MPQLVVFSWVSRDGKSHLVAMDASISEMHSAGADVTMHQVEKGSPVTDHIRPLPRRLSIEAFVTDTPINDKALDGVTAKEVAKEVFVAPSPFASPAFSPMVKFKALEFSAHFDRVQDVQLALFQAIEAGNVFAITTTLQEYENMAATSLGIPRSAQYGKAMQFSIEFVQLRFVETQTVSATSKRKVVKKAPKAPKVDSEEDKRKKLKSAAAALVDKAFGQ